MTGIYSFTKYFRDSVAAKLRINFKNTNFVISTLEDITLGKTEKKYFTNLINNKKYNDQNLNVIIVVKTLKTIFDGQQKINNSLEEMSGIYYVPAVLTSKGVLKPSEDKYPWIPREHLSPIIDDELAIGSLKDFDEFLSGNIQRLRNNLSWDEYFNFVRDMYEQVTKTKITSNKVKEIELEDKVYIIQDDSINATASILKLYDNLLSCNLDQHLLYKNFTKQDFTPLIPLKSDDISTMMEHVGQMSGEYPLSPSQRECLNHFNRMEDGEILAVNGPPGTGKTTLLQSLVANLYVQKALKKEQAPIIVASSTNNQAVTNIIESFGKIDMKWKESNLEKRWVEGVNSFAVYFPSLSKEKEAKKKGFQITNPKGENFFDEIESQENIDKSIAKLLNECNVYFGTNHSDIKQCELTIWERLSNIERIRQNLLSVLYRYEQIASDQHDMDTYLDLLAAEQVQLEKSSNAIIDRIEEWNSHFARMPALIRWFNFIPFFRKRLADRVNYFIQSDEDFIKESMEKNEIISIYSQKVKEIRGKINDIKDVHKKVTELKEKYKGYTEELINLKILKAHEKSVKSLFELNSFLDTNIKYASFWLAVHYYECRWLTEKRLSQKQKRKNFENVLKRFYSNLSMITPCFVMTFYQLPKLLLAYDNGKEHYLYNYIDLLIVDEAGQVTPEIAACSFSLAKRAVVVGDVYQIEPVWNINKSLDISLAISNHVINSVDEFEKLNELGLNTSESSVMKVACKSSKYKKHQERGLFLSEHRRCYNEIIEYCNKLVYRGNLEPKRGEASADDKYKLHSLAINPLEHIQVSTTHSHKKAGSRFNEIEAHDIAAWLKKHFHEINKAYINEDPKTLIGIITPFKAQVSVIKSKLSSDVKPFVDVGTVHTFQGGERKIIIMSTVYGQKDGCFFIDANKSLLNVALSRAKDSFIVMGDLACFSDSENKPSGLLKKMILTSSKIHS